MGIAGASKIVGSNSSHIKKIGHNVNFICIIFVVLLFWQFTTHYIFHS